MYSLREVDQRGRYLASRSVECEDDQEAMRQARQLSSHAVHAVEVWDGKRHVTTVIPQLRDD